MIGINNRVTFMKNPIKNNLKTVLLIFVLFVFAYFSYSIVSGLSADKYLTEKIVSSSHNDYYPLTGIALRDEEMVLSETARTNIDYKVSDGDRIAKNEVIASCSTVQLSEATDAEINKISRRIDTLTASVGATVFNDVRTMDKNIVKSLTEYLSVCENEKYADALQASESVQVAMNKKDIKFSGNGYYLSKIEENTSTKDALFTSNSARETEISSSVAGYFSSVFDGYETIRAADYAEPTVSAFDDLMQIQPQTLPGNYIGKIQQGPEWKYLAAVESEYAEKYYVGQKVNLEFEFIQSGKQILPFYIGYISPSVEGRSVIVFRCESLNAEIFSLRKNTAKIVQASYSGFKINASALHLDENGQSGVYVLSAHRILFKPVEILYTDENNVIVRSISVAGDLQLNTGDEIVVGGKNLYDGKIVNQ